MSEFPTIAYKIGGQHRGPNGLTYSYKAAASKADFRDGWYASLDAAEKAHNAPKKPKKFKAAE